jgi:hypothetical protein
MVSIRNDKTGEGEIDRSQSSLDSYWKISVEKYFLFDVEQTVISR